MLRDYWHESGVSTEKRRDCLTKLKLESGVFEYGGSDLMVDQTKFETPNICLFCC
jgi:hypothetical protein